MTLEEWKEEQKRKKRNGGDGEETTPVKAETFISENFDTLERNLIQRSVKPTDNLNTK